MSRACPYKAHDDFCRGFPLPYKVLSPLAVITPGTAKTTTRRLERGKEKLMTEDQGIPPEPSDTTGTDRSQHIEQTTEEYYFENGFLVFTAAYHLKRGSCCGSRCRHCPFQPRYIAGTRTTTLSQKTA